MREMPIMAAPAAGGQAILPKLPILMRLPWGIAETDAFFAKEAA
jgi:hypothetical protein